jgi:hypothetical protein
MDESRFFPSFSINNNSNKNNNNNETDHQRRKKTNLIGCGKNSFEFPPSSICVTKA